MDEDKAVVNQGSGAIAQRISVVAGASGVTLGRDAGGVRVIDVTCQGR